MVTPAFDDPRIYKFYLELGGRFSVGIPGGNFHFMSIQVQNGRVCMWAVVDASLKPIQRWFTVYVTGEACEAFDARSKPEMEYLGTFQAMGGSYVGHVFLEDPCAIYHAAAIG